MYGCIKCPAKIEHIERFLRYVRTVADDGGFSRRRVHNVELAVEEALVNICRYAYNEAVGDMEVACRMDEQHQLIIQIVDCGKPFNILTLSEPELPSDLTSREPGGLGVLLIRKMVDDITYRRQGNKNVLTLIMSDRSTQ
jgi:anti-sigma regulatory factor (Ser/Thr protein kinase)